MTGYLVMAVREARHCREEIRAGEALAAIDRLCGAWRYIGLSESAPWHVRTSSGWRRSHARAWAAVDAVRAELSRAFRMTTTPDYRLSA